MRYSATTGRRYRKSRIGLGNVTRRIRDAELSKRLYQVLVVYIK